MSAMHAHVSIRVEDAKALIALAADLDDIRWLREEEEASVNRVRDDIQNLMPDGKRYKVVLCKHCHHPGGQHFESNRDREEVYLCNLCSCPAWEEGESGYWSDAETARLKELKQREQPMKKGTEMTSVLQDWVMELPLREQGTLLTAVRGCDVEPKQWTARGIADSPGRRLTGFIRWCFMNPADIREVDIPGSFFQSQPPSPFKPSEFGHLPLHWYTHAMHALEVVGHRHPDQWPRTTAYGLYHQMVHTLHLNVEHKESMIGRLSEDRIATGTVVS